MKKTSAVGTRLNMLANCLFNKTSRSIIKGAIWRFLPIQKTLSRFWKKKNWSCSNDVTIVWLRQLCCLLSIFHLLTRIVYMCVSALRRWWRYVRKGANVVCLHGIMWKGTCCRMCWVCVRISTFSVGAVLGIMTATRNNNREGIHIKWHR